MQGYAVCLRTLLLLEVYSNRAANGTYIFCVQPVNSLPFVDLWLKTAVHQFPHVVLHAYIGPHTNELGLPFHLCP
ncbi:hypothetical protein F5B19DRAFT_436339 [Rostrohypoxylon terebratum]|nr:hypothetical protein F5B19DRAFT_436339 [Rostrohypoxylon terebratum]